MVVPLYSSPMLMDVSPMSPELVAAAGWAEGGGPALWLILLFAVAFCPLIWLSHVSWWVNVLGVCLLAADIVTGRWVGKPVYRFLREKCRIPEALLGIPLILLTAIPIVLLNVTVFYAAIKLLPHSFFMR
jgi:hypothetical protein